MSKFLINSFASVIAAEIEHQSGYKYAVQEFTRNKETVVVRIVYLFLALEVEFDVPLIKPLSVFIQEDVLPVLNTSYEELMNDLFDQPINDDIQIPDSKVDTG